MSNPLEYNGGMNTKNSSWKEERDLQQPAVAPELWRGALQMERSFSKPAFAQKLRRGALQMERSVSKAEVLAHSHCWRAEFGERGQFGARRRRLVMWASKARCHLSASQQG